MKDSIGTAARAYMPELAAGSASLLAAFCCLGGLFDIAVAGLLVAGVAGGVAAAYVAGSPARAAAAAGVGGALAALAASGGSPAEAVVVGAIAAAAAFGARFVDERGLLRRGVVVALMAAAIVGGLWTTMVALAPNQVVYKGQTLFEFLVTPVEKGIVLPDQVFYNSIQFKLRDGMPYYDALREAYHENAAWGADPPSTLAVREPLLSVALAALPGDKRAPVFALAALGSLAAVAALFVARNVREPAARLAGPAAVAAYYVYFVTMPFVLAHEPWSGAVGLISVALFSASFGADGARRARLVAAAAAVAVLAVAIREIMVFIVLAGIAAALFADADRRRTDLVAWSAALAACVAVLGVHTWRASRIVTPARGLEAWLAGGGVDNVVAAVRHGSTFVSPALAGVLVLAACGVAGAVLQRERAYRVFLLACIALPLAAFLFTWNGAIDTATGKPVNYWGAAIDPIVFALVPGAIAAFGMTGTRETAHVKGERP